VTAAPVIRLGVIGAGGIAARRMLPALETMPGVLLHTVMDVDGAIAADVAGRFGAAHHTTEIAPVFEAHAVYIASPVDVHASQAATALQAGCPVLLEKPIARTLDEAIQLVEKAHQSGQRLQVAFMMRFHPLHIALRRLVRDGAIGRPVSAHARLTCWYPEVKGAWRQDPARGGGGSLADLGVHMIDLLSWTLGPVRRLHAIIGTLAFPYAVEDTATLLAELDGGVHATIDAHFSVPDGAAESLFEILGTKGRLTARGTLGQEAVGTLEIVRANPDAYDAQQSGQAIAAEIRRIEEPINLYAAELADFLAGGSTESSCDAAQALNVQRVLHDAYAEAD